jgi:hypothetical protein
MIADPARVAEIVKSIKELIKVLSFVLLRYEKSDSTAVSVLKPLKQTAETILDQVDNLGYQAEEGIN